MTHSLIGADRTIHLKIVSVALAGAIAVVIVGGTLSACVLTLVVLPVMYRLWAHTVERFPMRRLAPAHAVRVIASARRAGR